MKAKEFGERSGCPRTTHYERNCKNSGQARPDLVERSKRSATPAHRRYNEVHDACFLPVFRELAANQAIYGYRRDWGHYRPRRAVDD
jgi:hypothetical protein